jgi:hypothetical protein
MSTLTIGGTTCELLEGWNVTYKRKHRATFSGTIYFTTESISFGDDVILMDGATTVFVGILKGLVKYDPFETGQVLYLDINADDNSAICDRRVIAAAIESITAADAITTYILPVLADEGITAGTIDADFTISRDIWRYYKASECLDRLADINVGYFWYVDNDRKLHFLHGDNAPAVNLDPEVNFTGFKSTRDMEVYRNTQYVITPEVRTTPQYNEIASPVADGASRTFTTRFPIAEKPLYFWTTQDYFAGTIVWDAVDLADIGVNGYDEDKKWYWSYNSQSITQADTETVLPVGGAIKVSYIGLRKAVLKITNQAEINDRRLKETSSSGIYDDVEEITGMDDFYAATQYAKAILSKYSELSDKCEFETYDPRFIQGSRIHVNLPFFGVIASYLIDTISITQEDQFVKYAITALDSASIGEWEKFFFDIYKAQRKVVLNEDEILTFINGIDEPINITDNWVVEIHTGWTLPFTLPVSPMGTVIPGGVI